LFNVVFFVGGVRGLHEIRRTIKRKYDMIWKIAKKEFLLNLMMFKFAVGTILCVVFMAVFASILLKDYQQRLENYNQAVAADAAELRKARVYRNIKPIIYSRPEVLSFLAKVWKNGLAMR